ncbi:MAG: hypothetical protein WBZ48_08070 [Bacteroidota bacterium]
MSIPKNGLRNEMALEQIDELMESAPRVDVQESEYKRLLGYPPGHEISGRVRELIDSARRWYAENGKPWVYSRRAELLELSTDGIRIEGVDFISSRLQSQLSAAKAHEVLLVAASAGKQCEERARQLWNEEKPDEYFFMEVFGSAVVENLITNVGARFCEWADQRRNAILPHYSPGYPGWDISDQDKLLKLIRHKTNGNFPEDIRVMDSGMLHPKKSLLAVFGVTSHLDTVQRLTSLIPCENCSLQPCRYRRTPYKNSIPQIEDIRKLQSGFDEQRGFNSNGNFPLNAEAKYLTNARALRKWSQERLHLKILEDRSVEARFRYEGTTCSNLGQVLEFDYHVKLSPPGQDYRIIAAECAPAPDDVGHKFMCQYLENAPLLMSSIRGEKPLLGKPLNDVLAWEREYNPSGCYCNAESREYKWGLVFEVLHFALAQQEKSNLT